MQAPQIRSPPLAKMLGYGPINFPHHPSTRNSHLAARPHKSSQVVQVQVVGSVVNVRIDRHDGVEEIHSERQRTGVCMDRKDAILYAGIPDSLDILRGAEP